MLSLRQGLGLNSIRGVGAEWLPSNESSCEAWYQKGRLVTLNGSDVSTWGDSSGKTSSIPDMVQGEALLQPAYSNGILTFTGNEFLESAVNLPFADEFTIGMRFNDTTYSNTILASNDTTNELIKIMDNNTIRIKLTEGATIKQVDLDCDGGTTLGDSYVVLTRNSSDLCEMWVDGVKQSDNGTLAGTADIDCIGARATASDKFVGTISEIQLFSEADDLLTSNVNSRLSNL